MKMEASSVLKTCYISLASIIGNYIRMGYE
jgi:hypothetical protein